MVTAARSRLITDLVGDQQEPWDVFVRACPDATLSHAWGWRGIMDGVLGHECLNVVALDEDGAWRGILPLVQVRSAIFGQYLISMPFLNAGGPVGTDEARALLGRWAVEEARRRGVDLLELRGRTPPASGLPGRRHNITVTLDLPTTPEALWNTFRADLRSQIRRPGAVGREARFGADQLDAFYRVFARHMRDLGTPVLPRAFFAGIAATFSDSVLFGAVYRRGEPVAAGAGFFWDGVFELTWPSALHVYQAEAPNMLLHWSFMQQAIAHGARQFDFGRCTPGSGTHRFTQQWRGHEIALAWGHWSRLEPNGRVAADRRSYRVAAAAWRRLPLAVANRLGPRLARLLP